MRRFAALGLALAACGPSSIRSSSPRVDLRPRLVTGSVYEVLHRETQVLEGRDPEVVRTRTLLEVGETLPDGGARMRAHIVRSLEDTGEDVHLVSALVELEVAPTGQLVGDPRVACGAEDELRVPRFLRYLLGARAIFAQDVGVGSTWRSPLASDAIELARPATYRLDALGSREAEGRSSGAVQMVGGDVGALRVTGEGRVRGRFWVSLDDGFSGRTTIDTSVRGEILDPRAGVERRGTVRTRTELLVRRVAREEAPSPSCEFDSNHVVHALGLARGEIQACYAQVLASGSLVGGRVVPRFRVHPDGRVRGITFTENTTGVPALAACMEGVLSRIRVRPAPVEGAVTFSFPFVFAVAQ